MAVLMGCSHDGDMELIMPVGTIRRKRMKQELHDLGKYLYFGPILF